MKALVSKRTLSAIALCALSFSAIAQSPALFDPLASNNGNYPSRQEYTGSFRVSNLDYGLQKLDPLPVNLGSGKPITVASAPAYLAALKTHLTPSLKGLINDSAHWDPKSSGWYDMVWLGQGDRGPNGVIDPTSGREPISNTYTGQIVPPTTYINRFGKREQGPIPSVPVQNHAVIYYNGVAAKMLQKLWRNPFQPDLSAVDFPDGSISVKIEAVTPNESQWSVVKGASTWKVYRPSVADQLTTPPGGAKAQVINVRPFQMSIAVKDRVASPVTGWVYAAFVFDTAAPGATPWDKFVPVGAMWGNDPQLANKADGNGGNTSNLTQTYFNQASPFVVHGTRGWGGRLAGPLDVANRANVLSVAGNNGFVDMLDTGASSCISCHSAAEFPWTRNLYPAPNKAFPRDGQPFVLFAPGSPEWARWFQNPAVPYGISGTSFPRGLDYDFAIMFALGTQSSAVGDQAYGFSRFSVH